MLLAGPGFRDQMGIGEFRTQPWLGGSRIRQFPMPENVMDDSRRTSLAARGADRLVRIRRLAWWLDQGIRIPGTQVRIGLDPILGLVPGVGDSAGALLGAVILWEGVRAGVPRLTLVRMAANIVLDTAVGSVPVAGDVFDAAWKSNTRNLDLLERHAIAPAKARQSDQLFVAGLIAIVVVLVAALLAGAALLTGAALRLLTGT